VLWPSSRELEKQSLYRGCQAKGMVDFDQEGTVHGAFRTFRKGTMESSILPFPLLPVIEDHRSYQEYSHVTKAIGLADGE